MPMAFPPFPHPVGAPVVDKSLSFVKTAVSKTRLVSIFIDRVKIIGYSLGTCHATRETSVLNLSAFSVLPKYVLRREGFSKMDSIRAINNSWHLMRLQHVRTPVQTFPSLAHI
jgi:hypothetical protein